MEKIAFEFAGLDLLEPMSLVTNWILAFTCFYFFFKLIKAKNEFYHYWTLFYIVFGLSAFLGGLGHLFYNYTGLYGKLPAFSLAVIANFFIERATYTIVKDETTKSKLEWFSVLKVIVSVLILSITVNFKVVEINTAITVLLILGRFTYSIKNEGNASKYYLMGILILVVTVTVQILKLNIHLWFNKDDFSHLLIALAMCMFYKATTIFGGQVNQQNKSIQ